MKKFLLCAAVAAGLAAPAFAGPQYIDETGFAVSGYDVVAYFGLEQSEIGTPQVEGVKGKSSITAEYNGATWAFSTEANRDEFLANPEYYAPQYDGHCAYGVSRGGKVPANPNLWRIVDDKLYLNVIPDVVGFWEEDIPGNLKISEAKWPALEPKDATTRTIPFFTSEAPISE